MVAHHVQALHSGQVDPAETAALSEGIMTWLLQAANQLDGVDNCRACALVKKYADGTVSLQGWSTCVRRVRRQSSVTLWEPPVLPAIAEFPKG